MNKSNEKNDEFLVDIPICVYNHEAYIQQTLDGILMQKTNFKFRIFIGEDCSTDNTKEIVKRYAVKYPNIIFPTFHEKNIGVQANSYHVLSKCTAKYTALCDGDDYWTDKYKLQKQIDFLQADDTISLCAHNVDIVDSNGNFKPSTLNVEKNKRIHINDTGSHVPCHTCSIVYRSTCFYAPDWMHKTLIGDWCIMSSLMTKGDLMVLSDKMGVYRDKVGIWTSQSRNKQISRIVKFLNFMLDEKSFFPFSKFRENLLNTKINYLKELYDSDEKIDEEVGKDEIMLIRHYESIIENLTNSFKNTEELAARSPIGTLINAITCKLAKKLKN